MNALHRQSGASLIEVLVSMLILAFGLLAVGGMLSYSIQAPKLAALRANAAALAANHIERMRANPEGFVNGDYRETMTYNENLPSVTLCAHPTCTAATIAAWDKNETNQAIRKQLPSMAGMRVTCNDTCSAMRGGDLWIIWQEPDTFGALNAATSDECPVSTATPPFTAFSDPKPRCLHVRFTL